MPMCLVYSRTVYRQCVIKIKCVVSCWTRRQSESICILIRRLNALKALRNLEATASNIANHALVFMVRGIRKRWKQPVDYYFIHRSTKCEMLVNFLMETFDACHNA